MNLQELNPYIRLATHSIIKAPFSIADRIIFDYELIYVADGMCDVEINDMKHRYVKDDILLICPGITHRFESVLDYDFSQPHIHFDMCFDQFSESRFISFKNRESMSESEKEMIGENLFAEITFPMVIRVENKEQFKSLFYELIDSFHSKKANHVLLCKARMYEILKMIFDTGIIITNVNKRVSIEEQIKNYIDKNYTNPITLDHLSSQFYVNKYTMLRKFKAVYGISPIRYVNCLKINTAKKLLKEKNMMVSEISSYLGFENIYSFSRSFKDNVGMAPTHYIKK